MPTLENFDGRSAVANIQGSLDKLLQTFGTGPQRAAKKKASELASILSQDTGKAPSETQQAVDQTAQALLPPGADPLPKSGKAGPTAQEKQKALVELTALNPQLAAEMRQTIQFGDKQKAGQIAVEVDKGVRMAVLVGKAKTFSEKRQKLMELAQIKAARGEDTGRILELRSMPESKLNLELERMRAAGTATKTLLTPTSEVVQRRGTGGKVLAQDTVETGPGGEERVIKTEKSPLTVEPKTDTGIINADISAGNITPEEGKTELDRLQTKSTKAAQTDLGRIEGDRVNGLITDAQAKTQTAILEATAPEFKSKVGKLLGDQALALSFWGEDSPQAKAVAEALESEQKGEAPKRSDIAGMRKEFTKLSGKFLEVRDAQGRIEASGNVKDPTAASDLSLIFNFMKVQDPGSVVRESEFETAQNATSLKGRLGAGVQRVLTGKRMLPEQRADFLRVARRNFGSQVNLQKANENSFRSLATSAGFKPGDVVIDFRTLPKFKPLPGKVAEAERKAKADAKPKPPGGSVGKFTFEVVK